MNHFVIGIIILALAVGIFIYLYATDDSGERFGFLGSGNDSATSTDRGGFWTRRQGGSGTGSTGAGRSSGSSSSGSTGAGRSTGNDNPPPSGGENEIDPRDIPDGFTVDDLSPYFEKVLISSVQRSSRPGNPSRITLTPRFSESDLPEGLLLTGWKVQGLHDSIIVPQGMRLYDHSGRSSSLNIFLKAGEKMVLSSERSPVGANFLINKCTGYLEEDYDFNPSLPKQCPRASRSELYTFTTQCQDYILRLSSCERPAPNPPIPLADVACRAYMNDRFDYSGCVNFHRTDSDFYGREWRVWLSKLNTYMVDPDHDKLLLMDLNGKIVDEYSY